ncbi:MAG TPA: S4 domain-containing protein, partial [Steroidobacteraceae bacterium]|nr:S4 domain-containing protein [Steroidobacteraceae bacterium]
MRLNKYISSTGVCSRREADAWIEAGRVSINGAVATLGTQVNDGDQVCVD